MNHVILYSELTLDSIGSGNSDSYLRKIIIPNLLSQYSQDYRCFMEYPEEAEQSISQVRNEIMAKTDKIELIPQQGIKYITGVWRERMLLRRIEQYVHSLKLETEDKLIFVFLPCYAFYTCNLVSYFKSYHVEGQEKVIRFETGYRSQKNELVRDEKGEEYVGFAYLCGVKEFDMYFKSYILIKEFKLEEFSCFPKRAINEVNYIISD